MRHRFRHPGESRGPGFKLFFKCMFKAWVPAFAGMTVMFAQSAAAEESYVEPGTFRLSHEVVLENIMHRVYPGWGVQNGPDEKVYAKDPNANNPWKAEWGQSLLTEAATRITPDISHHSRHFWPRFVRTAGRLRGPFLASEQLRTPYRRCRSQRVPAPGRIPHR
jgi:hypothetical protein